MVDHTLDPMPKRSDPKRRAPSGGRVWFSERTVRRARHYEDRSWFQLLRPLVLSLGVIALARWGVTGQAALLLNLFGLAGLGLACVGVTRRLIGQIRSQT